MSEFIDKILETIGRYRMLAPGDRVLVAWSGGPDSTALLFALHRLTADLKIEVNAFHLNHLLRERSGAEADFVRRISGELGIAVTIAEADAAAYGREERLSIQEAARDIRYRMLKDEAVKIGAAKVATGHHGDDVVETVMMRLLSGSGLSGLTGIPPVRDGWVIRPLIDTSRDEIMEFLRSENIDYVTDESNAADKYLRNRVRNRLMPVLNQISPDLRETVISACEILRDDESRLSVMAREAYERLARFESGAVLFPKEELITAGAAVGRRAIPVGIQKLGGTRLEAKHLLTAWDAAENTGKKVDIVGDISICHEGNQVVIFSRAPVSLREAELKPGRITDLTDVLSLSLSVDKLSGAAVGDDSTKAFMDADSIDWPLYARAFRPGDRFTPLGMKGQKKIHDFFIDEKVPRRLRASVPIICDSRKIVWIAGHRIDDRVKVTKKTERIAVMKLIGKGITER